MTQQTVETHGETVEEAVQQGLAILGLERDEVEIEVVDEGRGGFLGVVGHRDATVRLTVREAVVLSDETNEDTAVDAQPSDPVSQPTEPPIVEEDPFFDEFEDLPDPELLEEEETAHAVVAKLVNMLELDAAVESSLSEKDDMGKQVVELTIDGEDLGDLIGRRGETLSSFQYLSRLMVSQHLRRRVDFQIDVNGYRRQREEGLMRMAERMADKVVRRGRTVTLEPMSPYERRLIHVHLRDNAAVATKSIGQGNNRRIQIMLAGQEPDHDESKGRSRRR
jgi:spoIIIJ-associated protein